MNGGRSWRSQEHETVACHMVRPAGSTGAHEAAFGLIHRSKFTPIPDPEWEIPILGDAIGGFLVPARILTDQK
jgi:hypothetical protein